MAKEQEEAKKKMEGLQDKINDMKDGDGEEAKKL